MKTILVDALDTYIIEGEGIFMPMHALLETFPNRKVVLSSADDQEFEAWGLSAIAYEVFTLKHQPQKTDPRYYTSMLNHFGLRPDKVVYIEHDPQAVKSAESVGIKTYHYDAEKRNLTGL